MSKNELPPLPENIRADMQSLRKVEPATDDIERAMARLPERSSVQSRARSSPAVDENDAPTRWKWPILIPAAVAFGGLVLVFNMFGTPHKQDMVRVEEKTVALPESGHAWTALDLQTHHHADEPAIVHLEVPTNVRVRLPAANGIGHEADEKHCTETRCTHRFTQHHGVGVPVRIAVTHPGRYDIHVRHESKVAAMREHFVVTASRNE